jgi:hypothetical protein
MPIPQGLLQSLLSKTPFLSGVDEQRRITQQGEMQQLQQTSALMQLMQQAQAQQLKQQALARQEEQRMALAGAKTPEEALEIARKYADPKDILHYQGQSLDRQAQREAQQGALQEKFAQQRQLQQERLEQQAELARQRSEDQRLSQAERNQARMDMIRLAASLRQPREEPAPVAIIGDDGKPVLVPRSQSFGRTPASTDPTTQGAVAGAKVSAREQAERDMNYPEASKQVKIAIEGIDSLKKQLTDLKNHKGLPGITGAVYGRTPSVREDSMAAQAMYENVVNNIFVNALQAMRAASKTGGAVGNVSDKEGDRLQQTLAALSRAQGTNDFKNQAALALQRLDVAKKNIQDAYDQTYSYKQQGWKVER